MQQKLEEVQAKAANKMVKVGTLIDKERRLQARAKKEEKEVRMTKEEA
jgi:hypothetical protein